GLGAVGGGFQQPAHPGDLAVERGVTGTATFLVLPVRGDAELGLPVHVPGADLHLERLAFGANHGGVPRAVVVALGPGDVVVELAGDRGPRRVHHAERGIAGGQVVDQHPHRAQVVQLADGYVLALHLLPDAVDVLRPAGDVRSE